MEIEKLFHDLESNKTSESEEAKRELAEYFAQNKDQWVVQFMMEYFLKTNSLRIGEVLIKAQPPHDNYIFDRLAEWLKLPTHRLPAINFFFFVIRKHPTWLYKVEKHRLIKDIFRLFQTEKEIVPLMSALLCIITLLPIIPNSVPNFFNDLFDVFGYLASWNFEHPNSLTDEKLVHLQLGLQMLFHRLYGMYPCNFMIYLSDFIKKDKGAIFTHTIKPLLETVRYHPLLLTATANSEINSIRWKEMEPHDVVVDCASITLPILHQDLNLETTSCNSNWYATTAPETPKHFLPPSQPTQQNVSSYGSPFEIVNKNSLIKSAVDVTRAGSKRRKNWNDGYYGAPIAIWSPHNEFINNTGPIPLTPNPLPYMLPMTAPTLSNQMISLTGSSPPEAAVEATPETTPMKDMSKDFKQGQVNTIITGKLGGNINNTNAVRAIFPTSQPSSPMRKEQNHFNFPEASTAETTTYFQAISTTKATATAAPFAERYSAAAHFDEQSTSKTIEQQAEAVTRRGRLSPVKINSKNEPEAEMDSNLMQTFTPSHHTHTPVPTPIPIPIENITKTCDDCNETDQSMCTAGGLHTATDQTMDKMLKEIKRRHRMASYSYNQNNCAKYNDNHQSIDCDVLCATAKVRRTKSCSSLHSTLAENIDFHAIQQKIAQSEARNQERRLQKSGKMLAIATVSKTITETTKHVNAECQTIEPMTQNYDNSLFELLAEHRDMHRRYECKLFNPHQILDQFIMNSIISKSSYESAYRYDQEQFQLICLQLQYERYRREIHAERNRRLMGRSRIKRNLEMERDTLREQLSSVATNEKTIVKQRDAMQKVANAREERYTDEIKALNSKYKNEVEQTKRLRLENEDLQIKLNEQLASRKEMNYELEVLRGQIFDLNSELKQAQVQIDVGLQCKQELARLEAEFIIMGEIQVKCKDRLSEMENIKTKGKEELQMIHETYAKELKKVKHDLEVKTSHLDSAKQKIISLQQQLSNCEKIITEQKRLFKTVKDEYEERFKAVNKKYEVQKIIQMQMEEKITSLQKPPMAFGQNAASPDADKTDAASSMEKNSPLSTSLASSESLSMSLRSSEMRNLQQLAEAHNHQLSADDARLLAALETDGPCTTAAASLHQRR